jgi:hypothetical protein
MCQKGQTWDRAILQMDRGLDHLKNVLESTSNLLLLVSKTNFTEWYARPSQAPTLICLPYVPFWLAVKQELEIRIL